SACRQRALSAMRIGPAQHVAGSERILYFANRWLTGFLVGEADSSPTALWFERRSFHSFRTCHTLLPARSLVLDFVPGLNLAHLGFYIFDLNFVSVGSVETEMEALAVELSRRYCAIFVLIPVEHCRGW